MKDWWKDAPEWATVVMFYEDGSKVVYLETDKKGCSGEVEVIKGYGKMSSSVVEGSASEFHEWWGPDPQAHVVARKRTLTLEEAEILQDMGLLEGILAQKGYDVEGEFVEEEDTYLEVIVRNESGKVLFRHKDEEEGVYCVNDYLDVMGQAYKSLGFRNRLEVDIDHSLHLDKFVIDPNG